MMWDWGQGMGWWMGFGGIWLLLFWGGIIWLVVWGIRKLSRRGPEETSGPNSKSSPLDIAKERYAKGELTKEEYEQLKRDLS
jgi:putative membrane protein